LNFDTMGIIIHLAWIRKNAVAIEIERKFLVVSDAWTKLSVGNVTIRDGLIASENDRKVRVRKIGSGATLAIKGPKNGFARAEFEYSISLEDADTLLTEHCIGPVLEKTRHYVPYAGGTWEIDQYHGLLDGIVLAEIELPSVQTAVSIPDWIGQEVTDDIRYRKASLVNERMMENTLTNENQIGSAEK
jgi:adenylate cyclase